MKTVLLLGGSEQQVVSIQRTKELGYKAVTCDYLPNNPGHAFADEYYNVSTTDKEAVLELAQKLHIDGIVCYASDPSATTAAYVAEKLNLPGNPYSSVEILSDKHLFRKFLQDHGFCTPKMVFAAEIEDMAEKVESLAFPILLKPVDSSGSRGISVVHSKMQLEKAFSYAMEYSRKKIAIAEEYVACSGYQVAGDGFVSQGKLIFWCFGDDHFDEKPDSLVPIAATFPCTQPAFIQDKIQKEIQRLFDLLHIRQGAFNFDIRVDARENVYLMEIGARNGGNYIPQVIHYMTGEDMVKDTIQAAIDKDFVLKHSNKLDKEQKYYAYYAIHADCEGILDKIEIADAFAGQVVEKHLFAKQGDAVKAYNGSNCTLGVLILTFASQEEMLDAVKHSSQWLTIKLK